MLILLFGSGSLALYQVMSMEDQLDDVTQAVDKMDVRVKWAQHEKSVYGQLAGGVLRLAPKDPNANQLAVFFKLKELQAAQPELFSLGTSSDQSPAPTTSATNSAPVTPSPATNSASEQPPNSTPK
jgi:hypothetical protein